MQINNLERKKILFLLKEYLNEYGLNYSVEARNYIEEHFLELLGCDMAPDILFQIYAKLNIIPKNKNIYVNFYNIIKKLYGLDGNILEVGAGFYPILAEYIDEYQSKIKKGSITIYDPLLVPNRLGNIKMYKENFYSTINTSKYDLLVGIAPCEATKDIIVNAINYSKPFYLAMCGCTHFSSDELYEMPYFLSNYNKMYEKWVDSVYFLAKNQENQGFEIVKNYVKNFPYPIIYSKRK